MKKIAFVTGMTGQDGPYLAKLLLEKNYKVYGLVKRYSNPNLDNIKFLGIENDIELITGDITDDGCMNHLIKSLKPNESLRKKRRVRQEKRKKKADKKLNNF